MNRRAFFSGLAAIAAGATLDPERLLWRPGAKLISIPKPMAPSEDFEAVFSRFSADPSEDFEAVFSRFSADQLLRYNSLIGRHIIGLYPPRIGDTITFRTPPSIRIRDGMLLVEQPKHILATLFPDGLHFHKAGV